MEDFVGVDLSGVCWWCGGIADSREHRHKRSDLIRLQGATREALVWGGPDGVVRPLQGAGSDLVRFDKVLCANCNNTRSQPFDLAYDVLTDWWVANMETLAKSPYLDLRSVFGQEWSVLSMAAARYHVKNWGCEMAHHGMRPPEVMRRFLDGEDNVEDLGVFLALSESHYAGYQVMREPAASWRPESRVLLREGDRKPFEFWGIALIGYAGVIVEWKEDSGVHDSFYHHRRAAWNVLTAEWEDSEEAATYRPQFLPHWWLTLLSQEDA